MSQRRPPGARRGPPKQTTQKRNQSPWANESRTDDDGAPLDVSYDKPNHNDAADAWDEFGRPKDIATTEVLAPYQFRNEQFAHLNIGIISEYAEYRVIGVNPERAFTRVFGTDYADLHLYARIEALEHNLVYRKVFAEKFAALKLDQMYNAKMAVHELLSLANNPFTKCSTRMAALKELNVLFDVTVIDEAGRTRKGKALAEFYGETPVSEKATNTARHPEPGSEESEAFLEANRR